MEILEEILGLDAERLSLWHMGARAILIYVAALLMVRVAGDRRFLGSHAATDVLLSIILGSTLSRAINGSAPFFATLGAALILVMLHWLFNWLAFSSPHFDRWIKGRSRVLIQDGQINHQALKNSHLSHQDLASSLRLQGKLTDVDRVKLARLETSGKISVIPEEKSPRILEVSVEDGVQTVRIDLS